jgi:hypothetical protein
MNWYGTQEHTDQLRDYDRRLFSKCTFGEPTGGYTLDDGYEVISYNLVDDAPCEPFHVPDSAMLCRLYKNGVFIFEWRHIGGHSRPARLIHHSNGKSYLVFYEYYLYGYSVLDLSDMKCAHYILQESADCYDEHFKETFIWVVPHYDPESDLLAVEGCIWAAPYSIIILDFSDPLKIVEADKWLDLGGDMDNSTYGEIYDDFKAWEPDALVCANGTISKQEILEKLNAIT